MKNTRKGFTLVELVIVIAVIAILAGVLIATFASVIKRANDSAEVQNIKNAEIAQKADDIIKKIEEANWFGWEDFEADIVAKITSVVKENSSFDTTALKKVVEDSIVTALANKKADNTDLTAEQIEAIVANALGTLKFEGITEAQVRAIVNSSAADVKGSQLTAAQVKMIVNTANENNLTAAQVAEIVGRADFSTTTDVQSAVTTITGALANNTAELATKAQVEALKELIETTAQAVQSENIDDVIIAKSLNIRIKNAGLTSANTPYDVFSKISTKVVPNRSTILLSIENDQLGFFVVNSDRKVVNPCGLTIDVDSTSKEVSYKYWTFASEVSQYLSTYLVAGAASNIEAIGVGVDVGEQLVRSIVYKNTGDAHDVVIRTNGGTLTIGVDKDHVATGTITHYGTLDEAIVYTTNNSFHTHGAVGKMELKAGKAVAEKNGIVYLVEAKAEGVTVEENGGKFVIPSGVTTTDVTPTIAATIGYTTEEDTYDNATVTSDKAYEIGSLADLEAFRDLVNGGFSFKGVTVRLTSNITLKDGWTPIGEGSRDVNVNGYQGSYLSEQDGKGASFSGIFDGNNKIISNLNNKGYVPSLFSTDGEKGKDNKIISGTTYEVFVYGFFGILNNATIKNLTFDNVNIDFSQDIVDLNATTDLKIAKADSVAALAGYSAGNLDVSGIKVNGTITALDAVGGVIGRAYGVTGTDISVSNCTNNATIQASGEKAAGIIGFANNKKVNISLEISNNTNNGNVSSTQYAAGIIVSQEFYSANISNNVNNGDIQASDYVKTTTVGVAYVNIILSGNQNVVANNNSNTGKAYVAEVKRETRLVCQSYAKTGSGVEKNIDAD